MITLGELFTKGEQVSDPARPVSHVLPLDAQDVKPDSLRYWDGKDQLTYIGAKVGGVMVVPIGCNLIPESDKEATVFSADPKASFMRAFLALYESGEVKYTEPVQGTLVHSCVQDGENVRVGHNSVLGAPGFGFFEGERVPHIGRVILHDEVEIGSNTCIDRGTLGDTVIGARTKIDNLVHIAHNARIGEDCQIVAGAVIGGSAVLGDRVFVGINASIKNKVRIGNDAVIGMGAVVLHDVPAGATVVGNPARILEKKPPTA